MNDELSRLAPPIAPLPPPLADDGAVLGVVILGAGGVLLAVLAVLSLHRLWRHWRLRRVLHRVDTKGPAVAAAQELAVLVRRFRVAASPQWWAAVDAIRFAPERGIAEAEIAGLRDQVRGFGRRRR